MKRSIRFLAALGLTMSIAAPAAHAVPIRGVFSGVIASERNPDFTPRYGAGDLWSLSFQIDDGAAPAFAGPNFADFSLNSLNFVNLTLNGFSTRPNSNGFALRVENDAFSIFGPLNRFTSPFTRNGNYDFFVRVEAPGISTAVSDLTSLNFDAINGASPFVRLNVDGEGFGTFGGSTQALLTLTQTSIMQVLPPPPPPPPMAAVPVPAAGLLFASLFGVGAVWGARRRKVA